MSVRKLMVVVAVTMAAPPSARAGSWTFSWYCQSTSQGDCGATGASGSDGPYDSEGSCEMARNHRALQLNGPGNAGTTDDCREGDGSSSSSAAGGTSSSSPAHLSRVFIGATGGPGYHAGYANGRDAQSSRQLGAQLEAVMGRDTFGLSLFVGATRDAGSSPDPAATPVTAMWIVDWGFGLVASPFAIVHRPAIELRPELGAYLIGLDRVGCDRCTTDGPLGTQMPAEAANAIGGRLRAGLALYWGQQHAHGIALDALIQFVQLGDANDPLSSAVLTPPRVVLRLSWIPIRDR